MTENENPTYSEVQSFSPRIQAFILASTGLAGLGGYLATREAPGAEFGIYAMLAALSLVVILFNTMRLSTTVIGDGIRIKGLWFINRMIRFDEIETAEMREYKPLVEYGGWGYRIGPAGKAYNAQGNEGVQLTLKDGKRVLIGSQRATELAHVISSRLGK